MPLKRVRLNYIFNLILRYILYAMRQMGIISAGLEKATQERGNQYQKVANTGARYLPNNKDCSVEVQQSKTETLAAAGIDIRRAYEAEKLAIEIQ